MSARRLCGFGLCIWHQKLRPATTWPDNFVNLQSMFREIATKIVSGKDSDQVWDEWLAYYNANGGLEIEKQVNELIPIN